MTLPRCFVAAWERMELVVDGAPIAGGRAVWLEAGDAFVDVRGPGGFASDTTFAGTTSWADPYLTWSHTVDAERQSDDAELHSDAADRGLISFVGDDLIEEGEFTTDRVVTYREHWHRLAGGGGPVVAATTDGGVAVRVGDHAAVVLDRRPTGGGIAARYDRWDGTAWHSELRYGDERSCEELPPMLDFDAGPPDGWVWA